MLLQSRSGLHIEASTASDGVLDQFYSDYDAAFVLPNEKEALAGFVACLALNAPPAYDALAARFGPFREFVLVAREGPTGRRIGGANFIAFPLRPSGADGAAVMSVHLSYIFINAPARRMGYFTRLVRDLPDLAVKLFAQTNSADLPKEWLQAPAQSRLPQTIIFLEQNDPYRMSPEDYAIDTRYTGLDQMARIAMWSRLGVRIIDFPYVQPPLSADQGPDCNLVLAAFGATTPDLSACLLAGHLERFFGISVLKGKDPYQQPDAARQLETLTDLCGRQIPIPLLPVPASPRAPDASASTPSSLRDFLRTRGPP